MGECTIQLQGWQMHTWFTVDETNINYEEMELEFLPQSTSGTKVRVKLSKSGLKVTKMLAVPFNGSVKIPFSQIKNIYTHPKFPLCFFCTLYRPGYLLKIIMIRCSNEMSIDAIVNYYRTLANKNPVKLHSTSETTPERTTARIPAVRTVSTAAKDRHDEQRITDGTRLNNGDLVTNANGNGAEKNTLPPKKAETSEAISAVIDAASVNGNEIHTKEQNIRILSKQVEAIQELTLKKHPATISRQEYIDAHEKVHRLAKELSKQRPRSINSPSQNSQRHRMVYTQVDKSHLKNQKDSIRIYQPNHDKYLLVNEGKVVPISRPRAQTIDLGSVVKIPKEKKPVSILRTSKENKEVKVSTLPIKSQPISEVTADPTDEVDASISHRRDAVLTEPQEPIYARVLKNRTDKDVDIQSNVDDKFHANNSDNGTHPQIRVVNTPPVPHRTVRFKNRFAKEQQRTSKRDQRPFLMMPNPYHQPLQPISRDMMSLNTHVPKRIENVYSSATLTRNWKLKVQYRPTINPNTFRDKHPRASDTDTH